MQTCTYIYIYICFKYKYIVYILFGCGSLNGPTTVSSKVNMYTWVSYQTSTEASSVLWQWFQLTSELIGENDFYAKIGTHYRQISISLWAFGGITPKPLQLRGTWPGLEIVRSVVWGLYVMSELSGATRSQKISGKSQKSSGVEIIMVRIHKSSPFSPTRRIYEKMRALIPDRCSQLPKLTKQGPRHSNTSFFLSNLISSNVWWNFR